MSENLDTSEPFTANVDLDGGTDAAKLTIERTMCSALPWHYYQRRSSARSHLASRRCDAEKIYTFTSPSIRFLIYVYYHPESPLFLLFPICKHPLTALQRFQYHEPFGSQDTSPLSPLLESNVDVEFISEKHCK